MSRHKLRFIGTGKNYDVNITGIPTVVTVPSSGGGGGGDGNGIYGGSDTIPTTVVATLTDTFSITGSTGQIMANIDLPVPGFGVDALNVFGFLKGTFTPGEHNDVAFVADLTALGQADHVGFFGTTSVNASLSDANITTQVNSVTKDTSIDTKAYSFDGGDSTLTIDSNSVGGTTAINIKAISTGVGSTTSIIDIRSKVDQAGEIPNLTLSIENSTDVYTYAVALESTELKLGMLFGPNWWSLPWDKGNTGDILVQGAGNQVIFQAPAVATLISTTVGFAAINAEPVAASVVLNFANTFPADTIVTKGWIKVTTAFQSIGGPQITEFFISVGITEKMFEMKGFDTSMYNQTGAEYYVRKEEVTYMKKTGSTQNINVTLSFNGGANNPQDFIAGEMILYLETEPFETL